MGNNLHSITGLILAGGQASRMQHRDKGLQLLRGTSLVAHVIARLQSQVDLLAINANRNLVDYAQTGLPVWQDASFKTDPTPNSPDDALQRYQGPLAGVATGLAQCTTAYLLTVPCDAPLLPTDLAQRLMTALLDSQADIAVACTGSVAQPQPQPVFCLLKATLGPQLQIYFQAGGRRMDGWYGQAKVVQVHFANETSFSNINTLAELEVCAQSPDETPTHS